MTPEEVLRYCLAKNGAYEAYPFGERPICVKVMGHAVAQIYDRPGDRKVTLKCAPDHALLYRDIYPGAVVRGYHCPRVQQPYYNTVYLDAGVPDGELYLMMDHAHDVIVQKLTRREREAFERGGSKP